MAIEMGLETLLDLDGMTYRLDKGYWVKFEVRLVQAIMPTGALLPAAKSLPVEKLPGIIVTIKPRRSLRMNMNQLPS